MCTRKMTEQNCVLSIFKSEECVSQRTDRKCYMRNIKMTLEYDGARYQGWQRLGKDEENNTVENKIREVVKQMTKENVEINCGCRTEAGVNAHGQVINFKTKSDMKLYEIQHYFNRYLPKDIAVLQVQEADDRFHASLNAKSKVYSYRIIQGDVPSVFDRKTSFYCFGELDVKAMKKAANQLVGKHDFKNFSTAKKSKSTEKTITSIDIYSDGREVLITMEANDFLHNMARLIVGTLIEVGKGKRLPGVVTEILSGEENAGIPAEPQGLFLEEVKYEV